MSVAVAQMPKLFAERQGVLPTDTSNELLDVLLAQCQNPGKTEPLPGFGRQLVPYFTPEKPARPGNKGGVRSNSSSPQRKNRKAAALASAMVTAAKKSSQTQKANNAKAQTPKPAVRPEDSQAAQIAALISSWAGPGFCVSPTPEKLPQPSSALLG